MIGRTLSHYKILSEISRGGMGIVYRALDVKLDREVALKVLPPELVADSERRRRFVQEAKSAAKLEHPHIGVVHEIDETEDTTFIAMELIRGEQLRDTIAKGPLPLRRALEIATDIAEGLSKAHDEGIVHRDLKPANIMVTEDGHTKIIDFGLAKLVEPLAGEGSDIETLTRGETVPGRVMGTGSYMSPEQARGELVDHRSDIFSFGITVFEMLSGDRPFKGPTGLDTLSAILNKPAPPLPALDKTSGTTASELQRIVHRCLAKDTEDRYQTAKDLLSELRRVRRELDSDVSTAISEVSPPLRRAKSWRIAGVAIAIVFLLAIGAYFLLPEKKTVIRLTNPVQITSATGREDYPTWSPEGGRLAYASMQSGNEDIWVSQIQGGEPVNLTADNPARDDAPSWSPDGSQIAFWSSREDDGYYIVSALGGAPRKVVSSPLRYPPSPQWSPDGTELACIIYDSATSEYSVEIVSLRSQESRQLSLPGTHAYRLDLSWSPDGRFIAFVDAASFYADVTRLWLLRVADGEALPVTDGQTNERSPDWSADGRTLFFVSNLGGSMDLWQQRIREDGSLDGLPQAVTTGIGMSNAAFSTDGSKLAYTRGRLMANLWRVPILKDRPATWGDAHQLTFDDAIIQYVDVSRDGEHLLLNSDRTGNQDIWMFSVESGDMRQITTDPTPDWAPKWSPDGKEIAFYAYRSSNRDIWIMPVSGGPARQLTQDGAADAHPVWSPDGKEIAFASIQAGNHDIWIVPAQGGEPRQMTVDPATDNLPRFSPDGKRLVFWSRRGGMSRLWQVPRGGGEPEPLTEGPARNPIFSLDGDNIYFSGTGERAGNIWALSVEDGAEYKMTDFAERRGRLGSFALATDGDYLYFTWQQDIGDIWVMDVVRE